MKISFLGANRLVSGSCYYIQTNNKQFLIDCGLFRGNETITSLNYQQLPFQAKDIDFVILTHAHIDHCGRIPQLYKEGFRGHVYCTKSTMELCAVMLPDSGRIQEEDAEEENQRRLRSNDPFIEPLYSVEDALDAMLLFQPIPYHFKMKVDKNIYFRLQDSGHILGSSSIEVWIEEEGEVTKWLFSGDLGRKNRPFLRNPQRSDEADYVVLESTYGARKHRPYQEELKKFYDIISQTLQRGGNVIIPAFALQRTQDMIFELIQYYNAYVKPYKNKNKKLKKLRFYLDSPLAISATKVYRNNLQDFNDKDLKMMEKEDQILDFQPLRMTKTSKASKKISRSKRSKIIISASGMCDAGRIQYHLKDNIWKKENSVVFVGYQAEGTIGRKIVSGEKIVNILEKMIDIRANIYYLDGFSSHADQDELLWWISHFNKKPQKVFIVHGEKHESQALAERIERDMKYDTHVPTMGETFVFQGKDILKHGITKDNQKQAQLDEIVKGIHRIKQQFYRLRSDIEFSEFSNDDLFNQFRSQLDHLQENIKKIKQLIKQNEIEV